MAESVKSLCPYCGVGCGLEVTAVKNTGNREPAVNQPAWKVQGDRSHPSSQGMVCVKGATILESIHQDRLLYPQWRQSLDQPFQRVTWETAFEKLVERIQHVQQHQGADAICMYGSGQFLTEDYYTAQKLIKGCLGTNNFDANSRLCMSSAVSGYKQSLGSDGPPCCYDDLELTDCAFIIGANAAECHPILFNRFRKYHKRHPHVKLIVVDPRRTPTAEPADLHLAIHPGTDITLLNGIAYLLWQKNYLDVDFIDHHTQGFADYLQVIQTHTPERVTQTCGISLSELQMAAEYWGESQRVLSMWSMGVNQSQEGTAKVSSIINLHLMTGQIGKPGAGPFSLTGQPNAMGGREAGGLAHLLPGYRSVLDPQHRADVETYWQLPAGQISARMGLSVWEMIRGLEANQVGLLWIAATNPAVSLPDLGRVQAALRRSPFTVYQEAYHPTETTAYAHLLLPALQWSEKTGTMTNSERRVTLSPAFQAPLGEAREDWAIFAEVGRRLGFEQQFSFQSAAQVHAEFVQLTRHRPCDMTGISHDRLRDQGPLHWPCPEGAAANATPRLYQDQDFHTPNGRAKFIGYQSRGLAEPPDHEYPLVLTVGRLYGHWHTQTRTGRVDKIRTMYRQPFLEIHPQDAQALGVQEEDRVTATSRRGSATFAVTVTTAITPGMVFVPMHWGALWAEDAEANKLTHPEACPDSKQPELKACAVRLQRVDNVSTVRSE